MQTCRPVAQLQGDPIPASVRLPRSLAGILADAAESLGAVVYRNEAGSDEVRTYGDLLEAAERMLGVLRARGMRSGHRLIIPSADAAVVVPLFWASILGGIVPVIVPPGRRVPRISSGPVSTLAEAPEGVIGASEAWSPGAGEDPALMLLTSGSTGDAKLVVLTHANVIASVVASAWVNGVTGADVSLNWLPLCHVGGLMRSIRETYAGCRQVQVPTQLVRVDPLHWLDLLDETESTMTWAAPSAFASVVHRRSELSSRRCWRLDRLRSVYASGEMVNRSVMRTFAAMFEPYGLSRHAMHAAWGMTEACFATYSHDFLERDGLEGASDCGRPVPGMSLRIVSETGDGVEEGETGELEIRGTLVSPGYEDGTPTGTWMRSGDLGTIVDGRLLVTGRSRDLLKIGGATFAIHEIEDTSCQTAGVRVAVACSVPCEDREELAVFVVPESLGPEVAHEVRAAVATDCGIAPRFVIPIPADLVPRSELGKVRRTPLREAFLEGAFEVADTWPWDLRGRVPGGDATSSRAESQLAAHIAGVMTDVLRTPVEVDDDFFALGGSSLRVVEAATRLAELPEGSYCHVADLFRAPTARLLAARILRGREGEGSAGRERLMAREGRDARARKRMNRS